MLCNLAIDEENLVNNSKFSRKERNLYVRDEKLLSELIENG